MPGWISSLLIHLITSYQNNIKTIYSVSLLIIDKCYNNFYNVYNDFLLSSVQREMIFLLDKSFCNFSTTNCSFNVFQLFRINNLLEKGKDLFKILILQNFIFSAIFSSICKLSKYIEMYYCGIFKLFIEKFSNSNL